MIEVRDGYELGLLLRVMVNIDADQYVAAGMDEDTARALIASDGFHYFMRLGDDDAAIAASVIMARYQPQAERARKAVAR